MTQVARIFEEEKQQALKKSQEEKRQIVIGMIKKNYSVEEIASLVSSYSQDDVEMVREEIAGKEL